MLRINIFHSAHRFRFAHDTLTAFMSSRGFLVTRHYLGLETAWRAEFTHGKGGRVIGVNSEMDALPGMGHGCGHNLIAMSGAGIALAIKAALQIHNVPGTVVLLGTPGALVVFELV
jgi:metal-dependent amidase/aminoacylase/carboxypeptidase family protein